jgi:hypothetical protein
MVSIDPVREAPAKVAARLAAAVIAELQASMVANPNGFQWSRSQERDLRVKRHRERLKGAQQSRACDGLDRHGRGAGSR